MPLPEQFAKNIKTALTENLTATVFDVLLTAVLLYLLFTFLKRNNAARLIKYVAVFLLLAPVLSSPLLGLNYLSRIFEYSVVIVVVAALIMFPQELRRAVYRMASPKDARENFSTSYDCSDEELSEAVAEIVHAVQNMAKKNVGALIVVAPDAVPTHILDSGTELNSHLSSALLECLFNTRAPLHDGAVFIRGNKILAAGCFLPLSQNIDIDRELGTRHRAAIGITENYNVVSVIVSEETGVISTASNGEIIRYYDSSMLTDLLEQVYGLKARSRAKKKRSRRSKA